MFGRWGEWSPRGCFHTDYLIWVQEVKTIKARREKIQARSVCDQDARWKFAWASILWICKANLLTLSYGLLPYPALLKLAEETPCFSGVRSTYHLLFPPVVRGDIHLITSMRATKKGRVSLKSCLLLKNKALSRCCAQVSIAMAFSVRNSFQRGR